MGKGVTENDQRAAATEAGGKSIAGNSGTGSSGNSGRSRGRGRGKTESSELPKLVAIEVPGADKKEEEKKPEQKKGRGRPKGSTKKTAAGDTKQVEILLTTVCAIIGSRPGLEMFVLTPAEAKQIAEPLSNILAKNEALAGAMSEHGDAVALVTACFMIFVPKFIAYKQQNPKKEKPKMTEVKTNVSTPRNETGKNSRDRKRDDKQATAYDETNRHKFGGELHRVAEPIAGWGY